MDKILTFPYTLRLIIFVLFTAIGVMVSAFVFIGLASKKRHFGDSLYTALMATSMVLLAIARTPLLGQTKYLFFTISGYFLVLPILVAIVMLSLKKRNILIVDIVALALNLPVMFNIKYWEYVYLATVAVFVFRAVVYCGEFLSDLRKGGGGFALKVAFDGLPAGVAMANKFGQIIFINESMVKILDSAGVSIHNRVPQIREDIICLAKSNGRVVNNNEVLVNLSGIAYKFTFEDTQISCADVTEEEKLLQELITMQEKLNDTITTVESIGKDKAVVELKSNVCDTLAQNLSVLHNVISQGVMTANMPMLKQLISSMLSQMSSNNENRIDDIVNNIIQSYDMIGVKVKVSGDFPANELVANAFVIILREAVTNAVRHGGATEIYVQMLPQNDKTICMITNNGDTCDDLIEGEGIASMRYQMMQVGGTLDISTDNGFTIIAVA